MGLKVGDSDFVVDVESSDHDYDDHDEDVDADHVGAGDDRM